MQKIYKLKDLNPAIFLSFLFWAFCLNLLYSQEAEEANQTEVARLFKSKCAGCHGVEGDGQGPGAAIVYPKPRDFRTWMFKYKSTPADQAPTPEDLERIIKNGLPGTSMVAFDKILSEQQIKSLAKYIEQFSVFEIEDTPPTVVEILKPSQKPDIQRGTELYKKFECTKCHGEKGRGDGPSFPELVDDWENPVLPRDLTKGWTYRRGNTLEDIYVTLKLGIPGAPMPSFLETLQQSGLESKDIESDLWSIAAYVESLKEAPDFGTVIKAKFTPAISDNPDDAIWEEAESVRFPLIGQVTLMPRHFTPSVEDVLLKAIHNGKEMAVLVQWDDRTETNDSLPDKFMLQLPVELKPRERPFFFMGDKDNPVNLWVFENGVFYEAKADGVGTLQRQGQNDLSGSWKYEHAKYSVIFKRDLNTGDENDLALETEKFAPVSFFVWDGNNGESGRKCAVSSWYYLIPAAKPSARVYFIILLVMIGVFMLEVIIVKKERADL